MKKKCKCGPAVLLYVTIACCKIQIVNCISCSGCKKKFRLYAIQIQIKHNRKEDDGRSFNPRVVSKKEYVGCRLGCKHTPTDFPSLKEKKLL